MAASEQKRLKPVYQALEHGDPKKALQEVDRVLKKGISSVTTRGLRTLALAQLGQHKDAVAQALQLISPLLPDTAISPIAAVFKESQHYAELAGLYETQLIGEPDNTEFLTQLFLAYCRLCSFDKQQKIANRLYKLKPTSSHCYFWQVMSFVMQGIETPALGSKMFYPLAERMCKKYVDECCGVPEGAEILLYLSILEYQEKWSDIVELKDIKKFQAGIPSHFKWADKVLECLWRSKRWPEAYDEAKKLMELDADTWNYFECYVDSVTNLLAQKLVTTDEVIAHLTQLSELHLTARAPILAQLFLYIKVHEKGLHFSTPLNRVELIEKYISRFGTKPVAVHDLFFLSEALSQAEWLPICNSLISDTTSGGMKPLLGYLLLNYVGYRESDEAVFETCTRLSVLHKVHIAKAEERSISRFDYHSVDVAVQLAATMLWDLSESTGEQRHLLHAATLLHQLCALHEHNFQARTLLMWTENRLGVSLQVISHFYNVDAKNLQLASFAPLTVLPCCYVGTWNLGSEVLQHCLTALTQATKDVSEFIPQAYQFGTFSKVPEFVALKRRLTNSIDFHLATNDSMLLQLFCGVCNSAENVACISNSFEMCPMLDEIVWDSLVSCRDFSALSFYGPKTRTFTEQDELRTLAVLTRWLRVRQLLLRCLIGATTTAEHSESDRQNGETADSSRVQMLESLAAQFADATSLPEDTRLLEPFHRQAGLEPPYALYVTSACPAAVTAALRVHILVTRLHVAPSNTQLADQLAEACQQVADTIKRVVKSVSVEVGVNQLAVLRALNLALETCCVLTMLMNSSTLLLRQLKPLPPTKGNKKKMNGGTNPLLDINVLGSWETHLNTYTLGVDHVKSCCDIVKMSLMNADPKEIVGLELGEGLLSFWKICASDHVTCVDEMSQRFEALIKQLLPL